MLSRHLLCFFFLDCPLRFLVIFVAHEDNLYFFLTLLIKLVEPILGISIRLRIRDIKNDEHSIHISIADGSNSAISLGTCCIPQLRLHGCAIREFHNFLFVLYANGGCNLLMRMVGKPFEKTGLANCALT